MCPPAKIITMSAAPMANGGITPAAPAITVHPMVRTRKNVPMSSVMYLFMVVVSFDQDCFTNSFARPRDPRTPPESRFGAAVLKLRHHMRENYVRKRILLKIGRSGSMSAMAMLPQLGVSRGI